MEKTLNYCIMNIVTNVYMLTLKKALKESRFQNNFSIVLKI